MPHWTPESQKIRASLQLGPASQRMRPRGAPSRVPFHWPLVGPSLAQLLLLPILTLQLLLLLILATIGKQTLACDRVTFGQANRVACRCNRTHCDSFKFEWPQTGDRLLIVESNLAGARFSQRQVSMIKLEMRALVSKWTRQKAPVQLIVKLNTRKQHVTGFGGAFTDSSSELMMNLSPRTRQRLFNDYFGAHGLGYSMGRLPVAGSDMSSRAYSYDDLESAESSDFELAHFELQPEDLRHKIPSIKLANKLRQQQGLEPLKLVASSWSPPAWMKTNGQLVQGQLKGPPGGEYYDAYARYMVRFLDEYERHNISIWALTTGNEPSRKSGQQKIGTSGSQSKFNSLNMGPEELTEWLFKSLVPTLRRRRSSNLELKILFWDDSLENVVPYLRALLRQPESINQVAGLAIHWQTDEQIGKLRDFKGHLYKLAHILPPRYIRISTEATLANLKPGDWRQAELYASNVMENLRAGFVGWLDWNLALDMAGGPSWSGQSLGAPILVDPQGDLYYKNPLFYALGQISRFVEPASRIVICSHTSTNSKHNTDTLNVLAAEQSMTRGPSASLIRRFSMVLLNQEAESKRVWLTRRGGGCSEQPIELKLSARSITSLAFVC